MLVSKVAISVLVALTVEGLVETVKEVIAADQVRAAYLGQAQAELD